MLYVNGKLRPDNYFGGYWKDIEFTKTFGDNPIFPIDDNRFLILAEYIPPSKEIKEDLSIFGKMIVYMCEKDDTKEDGYRVITNLRFGHDSKDYKNGTPWYAFDTCFDVCWDYNVIYDLNTGNNFHDHDFFSSEKKNPIEIFCNIGAYGAPKKKIKDLVDEAVKSNSIDFEQDLDFKHAFIDWAERYRNNELNSEDYFMLYVSSPIDGIAHTTNNHWLYAYNSDLVKNKHYNKVVSGKTQLAVWMPSFRGKSLIRKVNENDGVVRDSIYALTNLIKYHFKSLNTGNKIQNLRNLDKYKKHFIDKHFVKKLDVSHDEALMDFQYED